jgi:orotate phosphoribosyltransferase
MNFHTLNTVAEKTAAHLLEVGAVQLKPEAPFTWASGWKSPIYCDNRLTLSYPQARTFIAESLAERVRTAYPLAEVIAGVATAGIPWAALVAQILGLPMLYIRSSAKGHGKENLIEGKIEEGAHVVIVEDLISTGGSSLKAADAVVEAGMEVAGMIAVFTYGFPLADTNFAEKGIKLETLSNYTTLIEIAVREKRVAADQLALLTAWRESPSTWGI